MQKYRKKSKQEHIGNIICIYATDWASATETRTRGGGSTSLVAASFACLTAASHQACETRTAIVPTKTSAYALSKAQPIRTAHCESQPNHNTLKINIIQYDLKTRLLCIANKASFERKQGFF